MLERLQVALAFDVETALDVLEMLRNTLGVRKPLTLVLHPNKIDGSLIRTPLRSFAVL